MADRSTTHYMGAMPLKVTLYSDIVCPFCYIAEVSSLRRLQEEFELDFDWRGFELHPNTPPGGRRLDEVFGPERTAGGSGVGRGIVDQHLHRARAGGMRGILIRHPD